MSMGQFFLFLLGITFLILPGTQYTRGLSTALLNNVAGCILMTSPQITFCQ